MFCMTPMTIFATAFRVINCDSFEKVDLFLSERRRKFSSPGAVFKVASALRKDNNCLSKTTENELRKHVFTRTELTCPRLFSLHTKCSKAPTHKYIVPVLRPHGRVSWQVVTYGIYKCAAHDVRIVLLQQTSGQWPHKGHEQYFARKRKMGTQKLYSLRKSI
jgi:hypothetical protein